MHEKECFLFLQWWNNIRKHCQQPDFHRNAGYSQRFCRLQQRKQEPSGGNLQGTENCPSQNTKWHIQTEDGETPDTLTEDVLYEVHMTVEDSDDFDLSETEKEIKISAVLGA